MPTLRAIPAGDSASVLLVKGARRSTIPVADQCPLWVSSLHRTDRVQKLVGPVSLKAGIDRSGSQTDQSVSDDSFVSFYCCATKVI